MSTAEQQLNQEIDSKVDAAKQQLATRQQPQADLIDAMGESVLKEAHTFAGNPQEIWRMIAKASAPTVVSGDAAIGVPIQLVDFYIHEADMRPDANGEVRRAIRSVLYSEDGKLYSFVSEGVARDLYGITKRFGKHSFDPPIGIKVVSIQTGSKYHIYRIVPLDS